MRQECAASHRAKWRKGRLNAKTVYSSSNTPKGMLMSTAAIAASNASTAQTANDNLLARLPIKPPQTTTTTPAAPGGKPLPVPTDGSATEAITRPITNWIGDRIAPLSNPKVMGNVLRNFYKPNAPKASADAATAYIRTRNTSMTTAQATKINQMLEGFYIKADKAKATGGMPATEVERYAAPLAKRATSPKAVGEMPTMAEMELMRARLERAAAREKHESQNQCTLTPNSTTNTRQSPRGGRIGATGVSARVDAKRNGQIDTSAYVDAKVQLKTPISLTNLSGKETDERNGRGSVTAAKVINFDQNRTTVTGNVDGTCIFESEFGKQVVRATVIPAAGVDATGKVNIPLPRY
jgi:hypothetical protein